MGFPYVAAKLHRSPYRDPTRRLVKQRITGLAERAPPLISQSVEHRVECEACGYWERAFPANSHKHVVRRATIRLGRLKR